MDDSKTCLFTQLYWLHWIRCRLTERPQTWKLIVMNYKSLHELLSNANRHIFTNLPCCIFKFMPLTTTVIILTCPTCGRNKSEWIHSKLRASSLSPGTAEVAPGLDLSHRRNSPYLTGSHEAERCRLMSETWDSCPYLRVSSPVLPDVKIRSLLLKLLSVANVTFV